MPYIYKIENTITHQVYIGQTTQEPDIRFREHKCQLNNNRKGNKYFQNAWNKYGEDAFEFSVIEECSEDELDNKEMAYIEMYDSFKNGYNATIGGGGTRGYVFTDDVKARISEKVNECYKDEEFVKKMSIAKLKSWTPERREKLSETFKGKWQDPEFREAAMKNRPKVRGPMPEETKKKISEKAKARGTHPSFCAFGADNPASRPVRSLTTGIVYASTNEAGRLNGSKNKNNYGSNIRRSCNTGCMAYGQVWEYVER